MELNRILAVTPRAAEYFSVKELQAQTGQAESSFSSVVLKELVDNGIDAAETAGVTPEIEIIVDGNGDHLTLVVADNGPGLPVETLDRTLDFNVRASTNSCYRSPTRGLQGNALKTVFGIVYALGGKAPVTIESHGLCHVIGVWLDPAGHVRIERTQEKGDVTTGTRITVAMPERAEDLGAMDWARAFSTFNPHATIKINVFEFATKRANSGPTVFKNTVDFTNGWRKFLPTDQTSPHWYQPADLERLVYDNIAAGRNGGRALTLRELVRQFRGLTGSAKAKLVCDQFPNITTLADFENAPEQVVALLDVMQINAASPKPIVLGYIGADHFRQCFEAHGLHDDRFWYKKADITLEGIPYLIEVAVGQTEVGKLYHGVNFSPTFNDPLSNSRLWTERFYSEGLLNFLHDAHCDPAPLDGQGHEVAVAVHLVSPSFQFLDRGKTRLSLPRRLNEVISIALWAACKTLFKEGERRKRDAARHERLIRSYSYRQAETSVKDAVFQVLPDAIMAATGGTYPVGARDLYYQTRPLIQKFTNKELEYNYFSQNLLTEYQQINGPIELLYYDPRGTLFEPHTGNTIPIGTREVEQYSFPEWTFNKILYIEKKGRTPILQAAKIPERYDLAIIGAEGYATEAARLLFQKADRDQRYQLFVLHDADAHGYNIARTLREETKRMPGYCVDVIDLGLFLQDALDMGLETENFTRQKQLPTGLVLSDLERKYFEGRQQGRRQWIAQRIELNALTAPQLVEYIERKLKEHGADEKVIPPDKIVLDEMSETYQADLASGIEGEIMTRLDVESLVEEAMQQIPEPAFDPAEVSKALDGLPPISWRDAVKRIVDEHVTRSLSGVNYSIVKGAGQ